MWGGVGLFFALLAISTVWAGVAGASKTSTTVPASALAAADYTSALPTSVSLPKISPYWGAGQQITTQGVAPAPAGTSVPTICGASLGAAAGGAGTQLAWGSDATRVVVAPAVFGLSQSPKEVAAAFTRVKAAIANCPKPVVIGQVSVIPSASQPKLGKTGSASALAFHGDATSNGSSVDWIQVLVVDGQFGAYAIVTSATGHGASDGDLTKFAVALDKNLLGLRTSLSTGSGKSKNNAKRTELTAPSLESVNASGVFDAPLQSHPKVAGDGFVITPCDAYSPLDDIPVTGVDYRTADNSSILALDHLNTGPSEAQKIISGLASVQAGCAFNSFGDTLKSIKQLDIGDGAYRYVSEGAEFIDEYCVVRFGPTIDQMYVQVSTAGYDATKVDKLFVTAGCVA